MNWSFLFVAWFTSLNNPGRQIVLNCYPTGCKTDNVSQTVESCEGLTLKTYSPQFFFIEPVLACVQYETGAVVTVSFKKRVFKGEE